MVKRFKNVAILCLFLANLALSVKCGFSVLSIIALVLAAIVIIWDIIDTVHSRRKQT